MLEWRAVKGIVVGGVPQSEGRSGRAPKRRAALRYRPCDDARAPMVGPEAETMDRRPLASRETGWARTMAAWLTAAGAAPNAISIAGMGFGVTAGVAFALTRATPAGWVERGLWLAGALFVQLRLLANLLDGMVAVEGNRRSRTGELYNEIPDRVSDSAILLGAGVGCGALWAEGLALGLFAALAAMFVSYIRAVGKATTGTSAYIGPMAKQHRMAVVTIAAVAVALLPQSLRLTWTWTNHGEPFGLIAVALVVIVVGCAITAFRRLIRIARSMRGTS